MMPVVGALYYDACNASQACVSLCFEAHTCPDHRRDLRDPKDIAHFRIDKSLRGEMRFEGWDNFSSAAVCYSRERKVKK
jgi:hypothetical protein